MTSPRDTSRRVRLAVLGTGSWARRYHLPALKVFEQEGSVEIAGLWNRTAASADEAAARFGIGRVFRRFEDICANPLDGLVVLVNSGAVLDVVTRLLPSGLPIFTEKPPGCSFEEARLLARRVQVPNVVAFNRRYMPLNRRFKELADGIDGIEFAECHFYRNERLYPHFVRETGVHGINFLEHLCGPIVSVHAREYRLAANGTPYWIVSVSFESGAPGILKFLPCCGSSIERYEVHGRDRSIYLECPQAYTSDRPGRIVIHEGGRELTALRDEPAAGDELVTEGLIDEYRDFLRVIADPTQPTASNFRNACNSMRIAEAIEACAESSRPATGAATAIGSLNAD